MKNVGVDFTPSITPMPASFFTSSSAPAYWASKSAMPRDVLRRGLDLIRCQKRRPLVTEEPVFELLRRSIVLSARQDDGSGRVAGGRMGPSPEPPLQIGVEREVLQHELELAWSWSTSRAAVRTPRRSAGMAGTGSR